MCATHLEEWVEPTFFDPLKSLFGEEVNSLVLHRHCCSGIIVCPFDSEIRREYYLRHIENRV